MLDALNWVGQVLASQGGGLTWTGIGQPKRKICLKHKVKRTEMEEILRTKEERMT